ncbi:P-II family nitrogen regulator [Gorillibacterium massiliense]|uniref:P-II family nitrogen regulator n=1 Tax=Gorillibacterium massiliense TaxID=1280390 RepID=UPI0004B28FB0|nr:P-II family nitrogen regulator [Gorillibacterium massiliense]
MKELIVIIRPNKISKTKDALESLGYPAMTASSVLGRGKQKGLSGEVKLTQGNEPPVDRGNVGEMKYIPKRFLNVVVHDEDVEAVIAAVIEVNRTGDIGDGRIFVLPIEEAVRVRTGETGRAAIS